MKKILISFAALAALSANAMPPTTVEVSQLLNQVARAEMTKDIQNVINWQVGDYHNISIKMAFGSGTGTKVATKEDTDLNAIWLETNLSILGQAQKTEALISRADGSLLKLIVNGKEQEMSNDEKIEVIEQAETTITVPAGTFDCIYIRANVTQQGQTQEVKIWANPIDINLDGTLKMVMGSQFGDITLTLNSFGHR
jgi:hypothetical protein